MDEPYNFKLGICTSYYNDVCCLKRQLRSIFSSLSSIPAKYRNRIIYIGVDGRYRGYDLTKPDTVQNRMSTDGSFELVEEYRRKKNIIIQVINVVAGENKKTYNERHKRQIYLDVAAKEKCNFILIMDADEYFIKKPNWAKLFEEEFPLICYEQETQGGGVWFDFNKVGPKSNIYQVKLTTFDINDRHEKGETWAPRLWYRPEIMRYTDTHYTFVRIDTIPNQIMQNPLREVPEEYIEMFHNPKDCRAKQRRDIQEEYESRLLFLERQRGEEAERKDNWVPPKL